MKRGLKHKTRVATFWMAGCAGCHMSLLDIDERIFDLVKQVDVVYSPIADIKTFPDDVDLTLVEGALANSDHIKEAHVIRQKSKIVMAFGDCAVTGNVPALRNRFPLSEVLQAAYSEEVGERPSAQAYPDVMPALLPEVLPLHQVIPVDIFLLGCPPDPEKIWKAVTDILKGGPVSFPLEMRRFG